MGVIKTIFYASIAGISFCVAGYFLVNSVHSARQAVTYMKNDLREKAVLEWLLAICLSFGSATAITTGLLILMLQVGGK